jgi:DNA invertase Pin-like site-specific DNA recombinase
MPRLHRRADFGRSGRALESGGGRAGVRREAERGQGRSGGPGEGTGDAERGTRLDRLARSTRDLLNVLATVSECGAGFRFLGDPWAHTTTSHGRLMLTVLGGLAGFERSLILTRTGEGRARAMARGVRFGRKPKLTAHQIAEARARREAGEARSDIGRSFNVSHSTISRL